MKSHQSISTRITFCRHFLEKMAKALDDRLGNRICSLVLQEGDNDESSIEVMAERDLLEQGKTLVKQLLELTQNQTRA